eukprot:s338_g3.t1
MGVSWGFCPNLPVCRWQMATEPAHQEAKEQAAKKEEVSSTKKEAAQKAAKVQQLKKEAEPLPLLKEGKEVTKDTEATHSKEAEEASQLCLKGLSPVCSQKNTVDSPSWCSEALRNRSASLHQEGLFKSFEEVDKDGDGAITQEEITASLAERQVDSKEAEEATQQILKRHTQKKQKRLHSCVSRDSRQYSFRRILSTVPPGAAKRFVETKSFEKVDTDGDGAITQQEITASLAERQVDNKEAEEAKQQILKRHIQKKQKRLHSCVSRDSRQYSFRRILATVPPGAAKRFVETKSFEKVDKDGDGAITQQEITASLAERQVDSKEAEEATQQILKRHTQKKQKRLHSCAWRLETSTFTLCARHGTYGTQLAPVTRLGPVDVAPGTDGTQLAPVTRLGPIDAASLCVAGEALGDIDLHFVWQAWRLVTWTFTLRGRRGTYGTQLAPATRLGPRVALGDMDFQFAWQRRGTWRGTWRHGLSLCVAGVALGDMDLHFVWQVWALPVTRFCPVDAASLCVAGVALGDIDLQFAWQAWPLVTWTFTLCARRGTW